jgi:RNA polymerase sigma-70 factor (ECF subfamily)
MDEQPTPLRVETLVEQFASTLYRVAVRLTGRTTDAEDLVQETFLVAHRKLHQLRDPELALAWLIRILRSRRARLNRRFPRVALVPLEEIAAADPSSPEGGEQIDSQQLLKLLDQLPDEYREPLVLFYFEELKYRDIAEALALPIGTVMSRLARAKAYLRSKLAPREEAASSRTFGPKGDSDGTP